MMMKSLNESDLPDCDVPHSLGMREELSVRNLRYAAAHGLQHEQTGGRVPGVIFCQSEDGRHGNFHPRAYERIRADPAWRKRLEKVHTAWKRVRTHSEWEWKELDCASSSDALLMNIFTYPEVLHSTHVRVMLGLSGEVNPEFGYKPRTPLQRGRKDNTEIDMKLGHLLVEAKLTESDFQFARPELLQRYRDFETVFDPAELPMREGRHAGYQLVRGTLAAHALDSSFCVLCDARRPALREAWYAVMRAVRLSDLRCRLQLLTWQELAACLPRGLTAVSVCEVRDLPDAFVVRPECHRQGR